MCDSGQSMKMQITKQNVRVESLDERFDRYSKLFQFEKSQMRLMANAMKLDVNIARRHHHTPSERPGNMLFLDTCVTKAPSGTEKGVFYAIDFGGTNLRCVRIELKGNSEYETDQLVRNISEYPSPHEKGLMDRNATATELFDAIALLLKDLMEKNNDLTSSQIYRVGFTFSFAMKQFDIDSAQCLSMSKGFETGRNTEDPISAPGTDIVLLLNRALQRNGVPAQCTAVLNDTTGTLISGAYTGDKSQPPCMIGLILGTGMNACYADPEATMYGYVGSVINTELGAYGTALPRNIVDHEVDDADTFPGQHILEKMVSGLYLPELCRRVILKVFQNHAPPLTWTKQALSTGACMAIAYEQDSKFELTRQILETQLEWKNVPKEWLPMVHELCRAVVQRAAKMIAVAIASLGSFTGRLQAAIGGFTCAVDGSLYTKSPDFRRDIRQGLEEFLGPDLAGLIHFTTASDGSGLGAGILAAMPYQKRKTSFTRMTKSSFFRDSEEGNSS